MNAMDEEMLRRAWEGAEGECGDFAGMMMRCWATGCWAAHGYHFGICPARRVSVSA